MPSVWDEGAKRDSRRRGIVEELEEKRDRMRYDLEKVEKALAIAQANPEIIKVLDALTEATGRIGL